MRRAVIGIALAAVLATGCWAAVPEGLEPWEWIPGDGVLSAVEMTEDTSSDLLVPSPRGKGYTEGEINEITNVVNGEVGGISGTCVLTYADGTQLYADACLLHRIHARIVDNQVRSGLFPSTVDGCVQQCWSAAYSSTGWRESSQWKHCREDVVEALGGTGDPSATGVWVPGNVFAATCDPWFASYGPGWYLWARVDWDTGWCSGTFYYYSYGG
jgi:hypothetical protein